MNLEMLEMYCNERNLSIREFEKLCCIGNGVIGKWKRGKAEPSIKTLSKISKCTGISIDKLIGGAL